MYKIYCAGFDVFSPDATSIAEKQKRICYNLNLEALTPMDNKSEDPQEIFRKNIRMINQCDCIVANLNDYLGKDIDSGTAFEIGYAFALNIPIFGYMDDTNSLISKNNNKNFIINKNSYVYRIEDFNLPVNLMIAKGCKEIIQGNFTECIAECVVPYFKNVPMQRKEKN